MIVATENAGLVQALVAVSTLRLAAPAAAALDETRSELARRLHEAVVEQVSAFSASGNPELLPDLEGHVQEHVAELRRLLGGAAVGDFEFVRAHTRRRATQRFPLEALLQAYRCLQAVLMQWARNSVSSASARDRETALDGLAVEYASAVGLVAAAAYVDQTRVIAEAEGDRRSELLNILISGYDEADTRVARLLKRAGYLEQRLSFCVAQVQSTDPLEMENPPRAQRIGEAILESVASLPARALVGVRGKLVTAVFSDVRRVSGWTAPQARLADRILPRLLTLGPSVLIGLSSDQPSTAFIPRGIHEATLALDFASVGERVVSFSALPIRRLLIHRGADYVQAALPTWLSRLREADAKSPGTLVKSLRALADADMNVQRAARELGVHANTLYARIQRVTELTGLDAQRYHDLTHLLLVADCGRL